MWELYFLFFLLWCVFTKELWGQVLFTFHPVWFATVLAIVKHSLWTLLLIKGTDCGSQQRWLQQHVFSNSLRFTAFGMFLQVTVEISAVDDRNKWNKLCLMACSLIGLLLQLIHATCVHIVCELFVSSLASQVRNTSAIIYEGISKAANTFFGTSTRSWGLALESVWRGSVQNLCTLTQRSLRA
jgi:hypothetical protein